MDITSLTAVELGKKIKAKEISVVEAVKASIAQIEANDIIAIVAPIELQREFLELAGDKPVITAVNDRVLVPQQDGTEDKLEFHFRKWERLIKIEIEKEDYIPS